MRLVDEVRTAFGNTKPVVLGGFSQGAMTAMDLALSVEETVSGVLMMSGMNCYELHVDGDEFFARGPNCCGRVGSKAQG